MTAAARGGGGPKKMGAGGGETTAAGVRGRRGRMQSRSIGNSHIQPICRSVKKKARQTIAKPFVRGPKTDAFRRLTKF